MIRNHPNSPFNSQLLFVFLALFFVQCLLSSSVSASSLDRIITLTESGIINDVAWLDQNFDEIDYHTWAALADLYVKCKWLETHYDDGGIQHWCFVTSPGSSQAHWLGFITQNYQRFADFGLGQELSGKLQSMRHR